LLALLDGRYLAAKAGDALEPRRRPYGAGFIEEERALTTAAAHWRR
jgi:hypothetical protein